jgi:hypothetical protein
MYALNQAKEEMSKLSLWGVQATPKGAIVSAKRVIAKMAKAIVSRAPETST